MSPSTLRLFAARLALAILAPALPSLAGAANIALVGGYLIDGKGGDPISDATVVIKDDTITYAGPADRSRIPRGAKIVQLQGKSILPGLVDAHMHIGGSGGGSTDPREFTAAATENNLIAYLKFGVTTVYDMAAHPTLAQMKAALADGRLTGPRLYGNGYGITAPGSHPIRLLTEIGILDTLSPYYFQITTKDEATAAVDKIVEAGTDGVKIFHSRAEAATSRYDCDRDKLTPQALKGAIDAAHAHGKKVYAHISFPSEAREVVEAGGDVIVHSMGMAETGADEVLKMMAERGAAYIPTLSIIEADYPLHPEKYFTAPLRGKVWDVLVDSITNPKSVLNVRNDIPGLRNDERRSLEIAQANLRTAIKANVRIAMGSDSGNAGMLHGATVVRELELMNEAGMTPMQALVSATRVGAEVIGVGKKLGTVESGKLADLIVVNGNPLQDISLINNVELVVLNGKLIEPEKLRYKDAEQDRK
jgi:imidazolonepropionase-like amidohydrolase